MATCFILIEASYRRIHLKVLCLKKESFLKKNKWVSFISIHVYVFLIVNGIYIVGLIKDNKVTKKSNRVSWDAIWNAGKKHSVHWVIIVVSTSPQKHHPLFFTKPPLNLQTVQAPLCELPPPKNQSFQWTPGIKFFILIPIPSFQSQSN